MAEIAENKMQRLNKSLKIENPNPLKIEVTTFIFEVEIFPFPNSIFDHKLLLFLCQRLMAVKI